MSRYEQRRAMRLEKASIAAGYRDMDAELALMRALDQAREAQNMTKEELARRMDRTRSSVSRLLSDSSPNPTLGTITDMLDALDLTAEVTLRPRSSPQERPIRVRSL